MMTRFYWQGGNYLEKVKTFKYKYAIMELGFYGFQINGKHRIV